MKKLFCLCILVFLTSAIFATSQSDFEKCAETFFQKGTYVKFTKTSKNIKKVYFINKSTIESIYVYNDKVVFIFTTENAIDNNTDEQTFEYCDIDFSSDENGNILITKK